MKKTLERGSASLNISLSKGMIIMRHGSDNTLLHKRKCPKGDWDKLCKFLRKEK